MSTVKIQKLVAKFAKSGETVKIIRAADSKEFTGQLVLIEEGSYKVATGKPGRPVRIAADDIASVEALV